MTPFYSWRATGCQGEQHATIAGMLTDCGVGMSTGLILVLLSTESMSRIHRRPRDWTPAVARFLQFGLIGLRVDENGRLKLELLARAGRGLTASLEAAFPASDGLVRTRGKPRAMVGNHFVLECVD